MPLSELSVRQCRKVISNLPRFRKALVVLSGGQDSTTCLALAKEAVHGGEVHAITFNYGQRHHRELDAARKVAGMIGVTSHEVLDLGPILKGTSPLTDPTKKVEQYRDVASLPGGLENTFVPGRNILFLTLAANRAYVLDCDVIFTGLCEEDFGGYPDCREDFVIKMEQALTEGLERVITIHCPLMHLSKAESVFLANLVPGTMDALAHSHTCYEGLYPPGAKNHASLLRARGFHDAGFPDPLIVRAIREGHLPADYPSDGLVEGTKYDEATQHHSV